MSRLLDGKELASASSRHTLLETPPMWL